MIIENPNNTARILQPYLVPINNGIAPTIVAYRRADKSTVPDVKISVKKQIGADLVEVLSLITDDKGEAAANFVYNHTYFFDVNYGANFYQRFEVRPISSTTIQIFLDLDKDIDWNISQFAELDYNFMVDGSALGGYLLKNGETYDLNVGVVAKNAVISSSSIVVRQDGNVLYSASDTAPVQFNLKIYSPTKTTPLVLEITTITNKGIVVKTFTISLTSGSVDRFQYLKNIKLDIGTVGTMVLALIITLIIIGFFHQRITADYDVLGIVTALVLGFFVYLDWLNIAFFLIAMLIAVFLSARRFI